MALDDEGVEEADRIVVETADEDDELALDEVEATTLLGVVEEAEDEATLELEVDRTAEEETTTGAMTAITITCQHKPGNSSRTHPNLPPTLSSKLARFFLSFK